MYHPRFKPAYFLLVIYFKSLARVSFRMSDQFEKKIQLMAQMVKIVECNVLPCSQHAESWVPVPLQVPRIKYHNNCVQC